MYLCVILLSGSRKVKRETRAKAKALTRSNEEVEGLWIATCGLWILRLVFKLLLRLAEALEGSEVNPFLGVHCTTAGNRP